MLTYEQVRPFVLEQLGAADLDGRSVCVIVPDGTRSCPMPLLLGAVHQALAGRVTRMTVLVALGTHARMGETELARHLGYQPGAFAERYPGATVRNHEWWDPATFASVGTIGADRIAELSEGRFRHQSVNVRLNRAVVDHDVTLVVGPVYPHEGRLLRRQQVLLPGVSSQEVINLSHWLGALITSAEIIDPRHHPEVKEVGYHCRDYFVKQWDRFRVVPWGVLAHSTHLRGAGTYDEATGIPEEQVRAVNLDYLDPGEVDPDAWAADPDTLVVPRAGEDLFRLR